MRKRTLGYVAAGATASLILSACGGAATEGGDNGAEFDLGSTEVVNPSEEQGDTLRYAMAPDFDSTDPGDTYYAFNWNFSRYYARTLLDFSPEPGEGGNELTTDLAVDQPESNDDFTEWTVQIQEGLKYEDGTEIVAEHIKYAIARSNFGGGTLSHGPDFFNQFLDQDDIDVYENGDDPLEGFDSIETPDDHTLVFHLKESFSEFPYILTQPQTAPVPPEADRGELYSENVLSSGPYKFDGAYEPGVGLNLERNEEWASDTDPIRQALPDRIEVEVGVNKDEIDERLTNGEIDVDLESNGVGTSMYGRLVDDESAQDNLDNPHSGSLRYVNIHTPVVDDLACRQAIMYAADRDSLHRAWGGEMGGDIATSLLLPELDGADPELDLYPSEDNTGDLEAAEEKLQECGKEDGFSTTLAVRDTSERDIDTAESLQESLGRVGIDVEIEQYPAAQFFGQYAGSQDFVRDNEIGMSVSGWGADWPTGYGFASPITHGENIQETGNYNTAELDDPEINELWDRALTTEDPEERADIYGQIERLVMESAAILPVVFDRSLFYRSDDLTNVYFHPAFMGYDFMALGVERD